MNQQVLGAVRAQFAATLGDTAQIVRAGSLVQTTVGRLTDGFGWALLEGLPRYESLLRLRMVFPYGTDVRYADQVLMLGATYGVVVVLDPVSDALCTQALGYELFDANGVPVYLRPNATVQVLRAGLQIGPASIAVRLEMPGEQRFTAMGGERLMHVLFPMGTDVRMTDDIRILTYGQVSFPRPGPYEAQDVLPEGEIGLQAIRARLIGFTL